MKHLFVTLAFLCIISSSCTDDYKEKIDSNLDETPTEVEIDLEALHSYQTDKNIMISSMIIQDLNSGKFILDLSLNDAESLGISKEAYEEAQKLTDKMNELNISVINLN